jgi:hypothetical protein
MSFDEVTLWLVTAMSLTAVAFLCWTLLALVRTSRTHGLPLTERGASNPGPDATHLHLR